MYTIIVLLFIVISCKLFKLYIENDIYKKSQYYEQTKYSYINVYFDAGKLGEYCINKYLLKLEGDKKFLFNVYIPRDDGTTTEIDAILIHNSGIYVFESKNYSGWIYGTETQQSWTQVLPAGKGRSKKYRFLNPIIQNNIHIKELSKQLNNDELIIYSYITFSDRCTLKKINLTSNNHKVLNRYNILKSIRNNYELKGNLLSENDINNIFNKLYPFTQIDEKTKQDHIENIKSHNTK